MTFKTYVGIGSRQTSAPILRHMTLIAKAMAEEGYTLRSGGANGADVAFELGCDQADGSKEIYLPWPAFNGSSSALYHPSEDAFDLAQQFHPNWRALSEGGRKLMARNAHQLFGKDLNDLTDLVICWTLGGHVVGGTGQTIRMAQAFKIPVINLGTMNGDLFLSVKAINSVIDAKEPTDA